MPDDSRKNRVEAVERALSLLQCFHETGETLTLAALAQRSGFYKSTILRLTGSLEYHGFLIRSSNRRFELGPELRRLGRLCPAEVDLENVIRPVLRHLVDITKETSSFYVQDGKERICRYRENSPLSTRHHLEEGMRRPIRTGAAGKILRAFGDETKDDELILVRRRGWASSIGERNPDLAAAAVPLFNAQHRLVGALTVSGPLSRFNRKKIAEVRNLLLGEAKTLVVRLPILTPTATRSTPLSRTH